MLLELFDWGLDARMLQVIFGLAIGIVFGAAAQMSRFCLRHAIAGTSEERGSAGATWSIALASAIVGFWLARIWGYVDLSGHRILDLELPFLAIGLGGLAFGVGMILTRGCASRLTVLSATGNMRAVIVLIIFAVVAHATLKGILAPLRVAFGSVSTTLPFGSFSELPMGTPIGAALIIVLAVYLAHRFRPSLAEGVAGIVIGLTPVLGWAITSVLLFDDFDPLAVQSVAFTLPWADTLFWTIASSAIPAGFGAGLIGGVLVGSFLSAAVRKELKLVGFEAPQQFLRFAAGAGLMGVGGVLAGGCTLGAGLSGSASLSVASLFALMSIVTGALLASQLDARARTPLVA